MTTQGKITAIQNEIAAAQRKRNEVFLNHDMRAEMWFREYTRLGGYIQGLNTALYLLVQETAVMEVEAELVY